MFFWNKLCFSWKEKDFLIKSLVFDIENINFSIMSLIDPQNRLVKLYTIEINETKDFEHGPSSARIFPRTICRVGNAPVLSKNER